MATWQFPENREHYAAIYGVSARTVSRWAAKGFPLQDEAATRRLAGLSQSPIERISRYREHCEDSQNPSETSPVGDPGRFDAPAGVLGLAGSIRRLQQAEREAHAAYERAREESLGIAPALLKDWLALSEQLRKVEQSTPEVEEANAQAIKLGDLKEELGRLFVRLRQDLEALAKRIALELVGQDEIGITEILNRELNGIIHSLYSCKYLGGGPGE